RHRRCVPAGGRPPLPPRARRRRGPARPGRSTRRGAGRQPPGAAPPVGCAGPAGQGTAHRGAGRAADRRPDRGGDEPGAHARQPDAALRAPGPGTGHLRTARPRLQFAGSPLAGRPATPGTGTVNDWDAIIGEAALGLDPARVDAVRDAPGLALAPRSRPAAVLTYPSQKYEQKNGVAVAAPPPAPAALDAETIFREEAHEFRARGHDTPGSVVRLGSRWIPWAYRATLVLVAAAIASLWFIRTDESTSGPVAVDGRT